MNTRRITFQVNTEQYNALAEHAKAEERSLSAQIRHDCLKATELGKQDRRIFNSLGSPPRPHVADIFGQGALSSNEGEIAISGEDRRTGSERMTLRGAAAYAAAAGLLCIHRPRHPAAWALRPVNSTWRVTSEPSAEILDPDLTAEDANRFHATAAEVGLDVSDKLLELGFRRIFLHEHDEARWAAVDDSPPEAETDALEADRS